MAMRLRSAPASQDEFGRLATLWVEGLAAPHDASCGCGGMAAPALEAADVEKDVLDFLIGKYRADASALVDFLRERRDHRGPTRFEAWIGALEDAPLEPKFRARLEGDLRVFLESFAARGRPRVGVCY